MFYRYNCGNGAREIMALIALQYSASIVSRLDRYR